MKKTLKTLIAVILAMIIATGSMSVFAANENISYACDSDSDIIEFAFAEILNEGKNDVESPDTEYFYFTFDAKESGYYAFEYSWHDLNMFHVPEKKENNVYYGYADSELLMSEDDYDAGLETYLVYLEKGSNIILSAAFFDGFSKTEVNIEFAGKKLTGLDISGGVDYNLIFGYGIDEWDRNDKTIEYNFTPGESTLTFDTGKKYDGFIYDILFESEIELIEGEYDITFEYMGVTFEKRIKIYDISINVLSIDVKNYEDYDTVTEYFDGCIDYDLTGLEFVITFGNGKKETIVSEGYGMMGIDLQNGSPYYVFLSYGYKPDEDGNVNFVVELGEREYVRLPAEKVKASKLEDSKHLAEENIYVIEDEFFMLEWNFKDIFFVLGSDLFFDNLAYFLKDLFTLVPDISAGVFENFIMFLKA